jgi:hypothetical protein
MQYLSTDDMAILTSAHQITQKKYYQGFVQVFPPVPYVSTAKATFAVGDIVAGATSGAAGMITEVQYYPPLHFHTNSISNTVYTPGENLKVDGVIYGTAYGSTLDETGVVTPIRPEAWILRLLGGNYWAVTTGIEPYRISSTVGYYGTGMTKPEIDFIFDEKTTKIQAIQKVCDYLEYVFFIKPRIIGTFTPSVINASKQSAYFVKESDIDSTTIGLDLPYPYIYSQNFTLLTPASATLIRIGDVVKGATSGAAGIVYEVSYIDYHFKVQSATNTPYQTGENLQVDDVTLVTANGNSTDQTTSPPAPWTITKPDRYLVSPVVQISKGEEKYNRITVRCQSFAGVWYQAIRQTTGVSNYDELPIEYYEVNPDLTTQTEANARADDLYLYYATQINSWRATFNLRSDFRLLQQLLIMGYTESTDGIADGTYRIVGIEYNYADGGVINQTVCTLILDSQFKAYLNLNRVFTDGIKEAQIIARDEIRKAGTGDTGTVAAVDAVTGEVIVTTDGGATKVVKDGS